MRTFEDIEFEIDDPVALIRLNRPGRLNAFTYPMLAEIRAAVDAAVADPRVVGIVITGNGRAFSAGLDSAVLAAVTEAGASAGQRDPGALPGLFSYLLEVPKPVIAAVNGVAAGGGVILALASDLRFASQDASFTTVFTKRGLIAEHGSSWLLPRLVGTGQALDLLWSSARIDARRAFDIGMVERLLPADELLGSARAYIEDLAANVAPAALAETKRLVYRHLGANYRSALEEAHEAQERFVAGADAREGAMALIEKRPAKFRRVP
ncbi:MAG: enoyl-CoA hydratase/isomerase family protein [Gammaproteobacteria bacterium]|nr:enoyl-CoA hydratase/isomerase family protein [Gammaproteobacteria bacterium]